MSDFGTVTFDGQEIILTADAEMTCRVLPSMDYNDRHQNDGEHNFEMSAPGVDSEGDAVTVYWIFENVEGAELDSYDYSDVDRVV